jgi:hypothetical protein
MHCLRSTEYTREDADHTIQGGSILYIYTDADHGPALNCALQAIHPFHIEGGYLRVQTWIH